MCVLHNLFRGIFGWLVSGTVLAGCNILISDIWYIWYYTSFLAIVNPKRFWYLLQCKVPKIFWSNICRSFLAGDFACRGWRKNQLSMTHYSFHCFFQLSRQAGMVVDTARYELLVTQAGYPKLWHFWCVLQDLSIFFEPFWLGWQNHKLHWRLQNSLDALAVFQKWPAIGPGKNVWWTVYPWSGPDTQWNMFLLLRRRCMEETSGIEDGLAASSFYTAGFLTVSHFWVPRVLMSHFLFLLLPDRFRYRDW